MSIIRDAQAFLKDDAPPFVEAALDFTAFALDQVKEQAERDGASLVILATHGSDRKFRHVYAMAEARQIPVIDEYDPIVRQGGSTGDATFRQDGHWNATAISGQRKPCSKSEAEPGSLYGARGFQTCPLPTPFLPGGA